MPSESMGSRARRSITCGFWSMWHLRSSISFSNSYVDEVQDNLLIDALRSCLSFLCDDSCPNPPHLFSSVLRSLVRNPDGLFWAGDTAQTISVGSSFRFDDLKAFLFRLEVRSCYAPFLCDTKSICSGVERTHLQTYLKRLSTIRLALSNWPWIIVLTAELCSVHTLWSSL